MRSLLDEVMPPSVEFMEQEKTVSSPFVLAIKPGVDKLAGNFSIDIFEDQISTFPGPCVFIGMVVISDSSSWEKFDVGNFSIFVSEFPYVGRVKDLFFEGPGASQGHQKENKDCWKHEVSCHDENILMIIKGKMIQDK